GEELHRAGTHRAHGHGNVTMPRDDDDRQRPVALGQLALQVESAHPGQAHINHEARRAVGRWLTQEFLCRSERPDDETYRSEEAVEGRADGSVIIHHEHDRARPAHGLVLPASITAEPWWNDHPPPVFPGPFRPVLRGTSVGLFLVAVIGNLRSVQQADPQSHRVEPSHLSRCLTDVDYATR